MKRLLKKCFPALKALLFLVLLAAALLKTTDLLSLKFSRTKYTPFFESDKEYDVLMFGSSRIEVFLSPLDLWRDYGITSYNFGNASERLPATYWTMRNTFQYAKPKIAVIDMCMFGQNEKYTEGGIDPLHKAWDCYPLSANKIAAIWDMIDDPGLRLEFMFRLGKYHSRWNALEQEDFDVPVSKMKGMRTYDEEYLLAVVPQTFYPVTTEKDLMPEDSIDVIYLRKILELCKENGVEPLLVQTPFASEEARQRMVNGAEDIGDEYGARFLNFVEIGGVTDPSVDMYDTGHVNAAGMQKVTEYLGDYLTRHYELADKRGESRYASWDEEYRVFQDEKLRILRERQKAESALMLLHDKNVSCVLSVPADSRLRGNATMVTLVQNICREHLLEKDAGASSAELKPLAEWETAVRDGESYLLVADKAGDSVTEYRGTQTDLTVETSFGSLRYTSEREGEVPALFLEDSGDLFALGENEAWRGCPDLEILVMDNDTGKALFSKQFWLSASADDCACATREAS